MGKSQQNALFRHKCQAASGSTTASDWQTGSPLPIRGCLIMLCTSGRGRFSINSHNFSIRPGRCAFIAFDMVTIPVSISADFNALYFSMDFAMTQDIFFLVTSKRFWDFIYLTPVFPLPSDSHSALLHWFSLIDWIDHTCTETVRDTAIRNEAANFITILSGQIESRLGRLGLNPSKNRAWSMVNDFVALLNRHYASHHDVAFYADRLHITPNYLNIITRKHTGISAKEQINLMLVHVIKTLLDTTDLPVKHIAERLHYDDPSYLCRIFRQQTGLTPIQYRNKLRLHDK